jgi:heat shock protein HtpX
MDELEPMMVEDHMTKNVRESYVLLAVMFIIFLFLIFAIAILLALPLIIALILGIIIASVYVGGTYSFSVQSVLRAAKARPADPRVRSEKLFIYKVEEMSLAAGLPMPQVYVQESRDINAFATGKKPEEAVICVTTGALSLLNEEELEGVMAHEMSHIKNNDILVATVAVGVVGAIALIAEIMIYMLWFGGGRGNRRGGGGEAQIILIILAIIFIILAPIFSRLTYLAISRKREYLADANGAYLTRNPNGLASALAKIKGDIPDDPKGSKTVAPLYIANPFKRALRDSVWSTHPPIDERIKRLRSM